MKILIVDDDQRRAGGLKGYLESRIGKDGAMVKCCECAQDAIIELKLQYYDVLILDVVLPRRKNDDKASPDVGVRLLKQVNRSAVCNKPERIIGMTADLDGLPSFRSQFESFCFVVVQADELNLAWRDTIWQAINYTAASKGTRFVRENNLQVITVHGIQTFGGWQKRLHFLCESVIGNLPFHSYKYGVFSVPAFFIPFMRQREVRRLAVHLTRIFDENLDSKFAIFCHSFGTYLVAHALKLIVKNGREIPLKVLVTAGSVLKPGFDWSYLRKSEAKLVNDCGDHDYVLYLSEAFVVGCGMAGKIGFYGTHDNFQVNRFFLGGHSSYFDGDDFMTRYWLPIFSDDAVTELDYRSHSKIRHLLIDKVVRVIGFFTPVLYWGIAILALLKILKI